MDFGCLPWAPKNNRFWPTKNQVVCHTKPPNVGESRSISLHHFQHETSFTLSAKPQQCQSRATPTFRHGVTRHLAQFAKYHPLQGDFFWISGGLFFQQKKVLLWTKKGWVLCNPKTLSTGFYVRLYSSSKGPQIKSLTFSQYAYGIYKSFNVNKSLAEWGHVLSQCLACSLCTTLYPFGRVSSLRSSAGLNKD